MLTLLLTALAASAEDARLDFAKAVLAKERGDTQGEIAALQHALTDAPKSYFLLNQLLPHLGKEDALKSLRDYVASNPKHWPAALRLAELLRAESSYEKTSNQQALEVLEKIHKTAPLQPEIGSLLLRVYEALGQRAKSQSLYQDLVSIPDPTTDQLRLATEMANTLFPADDSRIHPKLAEIYRRAITRNPADSRLAYDAAEYFRKRSQLEDAIFILARHSDAAPADLELRARLGLLRFSAGQEQQGEQTMLDLLEIQPEQIQAHQALARYYSEKGRTRESREHLAEALKLKKAAPSEFLTLADQYLRDGMAREARILLEKAVYFHPEHAGIAAKLAIATQRDPDAKTRAISRFQDAERLCGGLEGPAADPDFLSESADCLLSAKKSAEAEERLRIAIRSFSQDQKKPMAQAMRRLAAIWRSENRNEEAARALLQRADALDPAN
jgi:tetratricopeptide (TPR) repeat protein